jgi:pimeloyl-ACP methyl ester carboxylesterase
LNFVTYYQMKERAGTVGENGANEVLRRLRQRAPDLRLHLIGHSFGGRLVTAATAGPADKPAVGVASLTLLQAAFSHNGFGQRFDGSHDGTYRRMVDQGMVSGPVLISHTVNDRAVGLAYPIASQIAGQAAAALGDKNDKFGGMGRNGAQKTPEAVDGTLLRASETYAFGAGKIHNLQSDAFISHHGDVTGAEVVHAFLTGVAATQ